MADARNKNQKKNSCPWVPMAKSCAKLLPIKRPFTDLEAMFSMQLDHNNSNAVSVSGYAKRWQWNRKKVRHFLNKIRVEIINPGFENRRKMKGYLNPKKGTSEGPKKGQVTFINFNKLTGHRGQKRDKQGATTIEKENIEKENIKDSRFRIFQEWWFEKYSHGSGKDYLVTNWGQFGSQIKVLLKLPISFEDLQYLAIEFFLDEDPFITGSEKVSGTGHNIGMFLTRINQNTYTKYRDLEFREKNRKHIVNEDGKVKYPESVNRVINSNGDNFHWCE